MKKYAGVDIALSSVLEICLTCSLEWQLLKASGKESLKDDFLQKTQTYETQLNYGSTTKLLYSTVYIVTSLCDVTP